MQRVRVHSRSRRKRYTYYVIGQLMQIALTLYDVVVDIDVVDERQEEDGCHVTFRLDFDNRESECGSADSRRSVAAGVGGAASIERWLPIVNGHTFFTVNSLRARAVTEIAGQFRRRRTTSQGWTLQD